MLTAETGEADMLIRGAHSGRSSGAGGGGLPRVPQTSQSAVSRVSQPADHSPTERARLQNGLPIGKSAIPQVGKPNATRISPLNSEFLAALPRWNRLRPSVARAWVLARPTTGRIGLLGVGRRFPFSPGEKAGMRAGVISSRRDSNPPFPSRRQPGYSSIKSTTSV